ncbi:MAG: hypothetical protein GTN89_03270 [Acidobacteria bacterium]|nr:hypothetical protein [Acidobacteriota bacterium]NIQ29402.1 hypothetical protein [Acidobacteriota bacterium]NIQ84004.1 hypothetical protein [Acidobacteriota bacterium]
MFICSSKIFSYLILGIPPDIVPAARVFVLDDTGYKRLFRSALGATVSVALLLLLFRVADVREVASRITLFSAPGLALAVGITLICIPLRALQWQWLLGKPKSASFGEILRSLSLGYLGNCLLPMRGGELLRTYLLARAASLRIGRVFVSVVLNRVQDLPPILLLLMLTLGLLEFDRPLVFDGAGLLQDPVEIPPAQLTGALHGFAWAIGIVAVAMLASFLFLEPIERLLLRLNSRLPRTWSARLELHILQGVEAFRIVGRPSFFWGAQLLSAIGWMLFVAMGVPLLGDLGLGTAEAFRVSIAVLGLSVVAQMLPALPGAVGTFHVAAVLALLLMKPETEPSTAIAFSLVFHFVSNIVPGIVGLAYLPTSWSRFLGALAQRRRSGGETNPAGE